jgi:RNA polymerase sigma-70 factor (ECF subfamily)
MDELLIHNSGKEMPSDGSAAPPLTAERVFRDYAPRIFRLARRLLKSDDDAEDVLQDVLVRVVEKLSTFRGDAAFATWLHRVTVNAALAHRRKLSVRHEQSAGAAPDVLEEGRQPTGVKRIMPRPEDALVEAETEQIIHRAIAHLPAGYRDVFVMSELEGLPNAAIAEKLNLSLSALKSRLLRSRAMMREALAPHFLDQESGVQESGIRG